MPVKENRSKLDRRKKLVYTPDLYRLPNIIEETKSDTLEEKSDVKEETSEQSEYATSEDLEYAVSEDDDELYDVLSIYSASKESDYDIYMALMNTITVLQRLEPKEYSLYQNTFADYLRSYKAFINNKAPLLESIKELSAKNESSSGCWIFFKGKKPVNSLTNQLVTLMIDSGLQMSLVSIQKIHDLAKDPSTSIAMAKSGGR